MLSRCTFDALYRAHVDLVRRHLLRWKGIQRADRENIEQVVWIKVLNGWPTDPPPDSDAAYLITIVKNAAKELFKRKAAQKCDDSLTSPLIDEGASGPIDVILVDDCDVPVEFERVRTAKRVRAIARELGPRDAAIFDRMMLDDDSVPSRDRKRVVDAMRKLMELSGRPRSVEHPDIVEGPSHCGRTVRRLEQKRRDSGLDLDHDDSEQGEEEMLDAAE